jgi:hypothetical protein
MDLRMIWLVLTIAFCACVVLAGRAHSRYLDRKDARRAALRAMIMGATPKSSGKDLSQSSGEPER